ncbi:MAG: DNA polymerase III subunit gamma/tau [Planctomycetota bacterium]|nr:DNA polymerase III subunit gamma/tau [Planctomycetota bacterium]
MSESSSSNSGSYQVLARRYRSRSFDELVGQQAIIRTLRNAIAQQRTAHAYLFCGTRGVGKTSAARIFAKELMWHGLAVRGEDALPEAASDAIFRGEDIDVVEIDGASHNGVNEVRELITNSGLMPARMPYKLYIIDEVHMLSTQAFNALLKTMEEPPDHVKFVLCTTEPQKVPQTIQSRCQRFDFRTIPDRQIADHLCEILRSEGITFDEHVPLEVARLAEGSMRDGLTLLDRVVSAAEGALTAELLSEVLGLPDESLLGTLVEAIAGSDVATTLGTAGELIANGMAPAHLLDALAERLRRVLVVLTCGPDSDLGGMTEEAAERCAEVGRSLDPPSLVHMIVACDAGSRQVRTSGTPRALMEAILVRLCYVEAFARAAGLLEDGSGGSGKKEPARAR